MQNRRKALATALGAIAFLSCKSGNASPGAPAAPPPQAASSHASAGAAHDPKASNGTEAPPALTNKDASAEQDGGGSVSPPDGMVYVPGGTFLMGMPSSITQGDPPQQRQVKPFFLDRLEVTTEAFLACVNAGRCEVAAHKPGCNGTAKKPKLKHPINCVTKQQAERFCAEQGKRLPTAAEWEFAARGADGRVYPWGNELPSEQLCWQGRKGAESEMTCPVGSFAQGASPFGALDMAGNVAEWTSSENKEAAGPGAFYVRGGGFPLDDLARADGPDSYDVRSDNARSFGDDSVLRDVGVRCAKDL